MNCIEEGSALVEASLGKTIANVWVDKGRNSLKLFFGDGSAIELLDAGQTCCEERYMHTDDKLQDFCGSTLQDIDVWNGQDEWFEDDNGHEQVRESQFLVVTTSVGQFTVVNYNEHEGYYDGFKLIACEVM